MSRIRNFIRRLVYGPPKPPEDYADRLRKLGVRIGERTTFFDPGSCVVDITRPWLVEIGDDVQITHGVVILTHGYDWSVIKGLHAEVMGSAGKVTIGNNVFIGVNTVILKGVTIGSNVIIGAGSLVNKDIPDNCVAAGNPARVVMSLEEYREKRRAAQEEEAKQLVREYRKVYGKDPGEYQLHEFFWLFTNDPRKVTHPKWVGLMDSHGNRQLSDQVLARQKPPYRDLQDFLDHC